MRLTLVCLIATLALACGDSASGADAGPDADTRDCVGNGGADCWLMPTETLQKRDTTNAANLACTPTAVQFSTMAITVTGTAVDFQNNGTVLNAATVTAFALDDLTFSALLAQDTTAADGSYTLTLPIGVGSRINWRTTHIDALDTYGINTPLDISLMNVVAERQAVSILSANAIPALVGSSRTPGLGSVAGSVVDCDGDEVRNAIATVSSTSGAGNALPTFVAGAQVFYFSGALPANRSAQKSTSSNGTLVAIEIPPGQAYFQVWGFIGAGDVAMGEAGLTLISEFLTPVLADSVLSIEMEPSESL